MIPGIITTTTMPAASRPTPSANHFRSTPPTNIITTPMVTIRMVPDRCGSKTIRPAITPSTIMNGSIPYRSVFILSPYIVTILANRITTANLAISDGWNVVKFPMGIHRCTPAILGINSTTINSRIATPITGTASFCQ